MSRLGVARPDIDILSSVTSLSWRNHSEARGTVRSIVAKTNNYLRCALLSSFLEILVPRQGANALLRPFLVHHGKNAPG